MPLKVTVTKKEEGVFVVSPQGSIDTETYPVLEKEINSILEQAKKAVILDLKEVAYVSSMGLSVIFKTKEALENNGGTIAIINLQPQIKKVFEAIKVLPDYYFSTMTDAEKYLDDFLTDVQEKATDKEKQQDG